MDVFDVKGATDVARKAVGGSAHLGEAEIARASNATHGARRGMPLTGGLPSFEAAMMDDRLAQKAVAELGSAELIAERGANGYPCKIQAWRGAIDGGTAIVRQVALRRRKVKPKGLACCRFRGRRDKLFDETGGELWRGMFAHGRLRSRQSGIVARHCGAPRQDD